MHIMIINAMDGEPNLIRKDAIRYARPWDVGVKMYVDGIGEMRTETYDFQGLCAELQIEEAIIESLDEDKAA